MLNHRDFRVNFFSINSNNLFFVILNSHNNCVYHNENNIIVTFWTLNNFCESWSKIFFRLFRIFKNAKTIAKLKYIVKTIHNIMNIRREIFKRTKLKYQMIIDAKRINDFHEIIRTLQFFVYKYVNKSLRVKKKNDETKLTM